LGERPAQSLVVGAGGLQHDEIARRSDPPGERGAFTRSVGDPLRDAGSGVENVEKVFRNVAADETRVYDHDACPCDARSVASSLVQLFRWI